MQWLQSWQPTNSEHTLTHWLTDWVSDSPTRIQVVLAHLKIGSRDIVLLHSWNHWQMESSPEGLASWDPWLWDMIVAVCCQSHNSCGIVSLFAHSNSSKKYFLILLILIPYLPQSPFLWRCVLICPSRFEQEEFSDSSTAFSKVAILAASCPH